MDIAWLESLLSLVDEGSFTRAAETQGLSQPAFSRRIRALERWFGADLLDRSTFPVQLTPVGVEVVGYARGTVADLAGIRDDARGQRRAPRNAVRFAISHTIAAHYFPAWWTSIADGSVGLSCQLFPTNTLEAYDLLTQGGCDLLLTYDDPLQPVGAREGELEWIVVARDLLAPYAMARGARPPVTPLPGEDGRIPFVAHGSGAFLGRVTERVIAPLGLDLHPVAQSDLTTALTGLVVSGVGMGWLPGLAVESAITSGAIVHVGDPGWTARLEIRLYRRSSGILSDQAESVWRRATPV